MYIFWKKAHKEDFSIYIFKCSTSELLINVEALKVFWVFTQLVLIYSILKEKVNGT